MSGASCVKEFQAVAEAAPGKVKREIPPPFSLRLSLAERTKLEAEAGNQPLGTYIRDRLLGSKAEKRRRSHRPQVDQALLAQVLGKLGETRLASNMNQIAKAANIGTLDLPADVPRDITQACRDIRAMRETLISALGLKADSDE